MAPTGRVAVRGELASAGGGLTMHEIADDLFVSHDTVKTHSRTLFCKLNASTPDRRRGSPGATDCRRQLLPPSNQRARQPAAIDGGS